MRTMAACITVGVLLAATACTGESPKPEGEGPAAKPLTFDNKPLWTISGGADPDQADKHSGLEEVFDIGLVGDQLILVGYDEDGDLNDKGYAAGAIVAVDAKTGERSWTVNSELPLPDEPQMTVAIGSGTEVQVVDDGGQDAIAVGYEKSSKDAFEIGVVALAADNGKVRSHARAAEESRMLSIQGSDGADVLVDVRDESDDDAAESMLLNLATGKRTWSRDGASAVAMAEDTVLLENPPKTNSDESFQAVARHNGEKLWDTRALFKEAVEGVSVTADVVIANTLDGAVVLDAKTGKQRDILRQETLKRCVVGDRSLIACNILNRGVATISATGKSPSFSNVPNTDGIATTAVTSGWIFTTKKGKDDARIAFDPAGNTMEIPGKVADIKNKRAVTYTGEMGGEVTTISMHKVND